MAATPPELTPLESSHAHARDRFRAADALQRRLEETREHGAPVLPRGAGTSLAGQCCNVAVVLDFSKYMHGILALDPAARTARVQPGVVLDHVRDAAEQHHLTFAPDPATHSRCTLGGMIGNNSCGVHALMGGKTVDNVERLEVLLYDGTRMTVGPTSDPELAQILAAGGRKAEIYAGLKRIRDTYAPLIRERFPRIPRRVSGYNLDELLPENGFQVARALVGTEGTCAIVLEATLRLTASPPFRRLVGIGFSDPYLAADVVPEILSHEPIGLEGFDGHVIDAMRSKQMRLDELKLLPEGRGTLLVEFGAWTEEEVDARAEAFGRWVATLPSHPGHRIYTRGEAAHAWAVREAALGAVAIQPGKRPAWEGWEDAAVPPDRLGVYLRRLRGLLEEYGYESPLYGHFGDGCVHTRITFDLQSTPGILEFRAFLDRATDLVVSLGGSISGEHGDGQSRGALLPKMFGPELVQAFRDFKRLWDPDNRMNPGKVVDARQPQQDLRLGADYRPRRIETYFEFPSDGGSLEAATLRCVGVGACRKQLSGVMCPSYMVTREERHSTRGRAHLLWEMLQGEVIERGWQSEAVKEALDLCLSCKGCKGECPTQVDMATYKAEFLAHYYQGRRRPLRAYAFGRLDRWARLASRTPRLANALGRAGPTRALANRLLGLHPLRRLPEVARTTFRDRVAGRAPPPGTHGDVLLWADTFTNYFQPHVAEAAYEVLARAGFRVRVVERPVCCGRPLYDFGLLEHARRYLTDAMDAVAGELAAGTPIVVLEPSCASVFRDEATNLLAGDPRVGKLRAQTMLLGELLARHAPDYRPAALDPERPILVHPHCHQRSVLGIDSEIALLEATGGKVQLLDSGCCGMAGPFGFERDKYEVSQALGERVLLPAVRGAAEGTVIVSDGFSCREQIAQNTFARAVHLAEVLAGRV